MKIRSLSPVLCLSAAAFLFQGCFLVRMFAPAPTPAERIDEFRRDVAAGVFSVRLPERTRIDTVVLDAAAKTLRVDFNEELANAPIRPDYCVRLEKGVAEYFGAQCPGYRVTLRSLRHPLGELVPNYYRADTSLYDRSRLPVPAPRPLPVVRNVSRPYSVGSGLNDRNIILWHSHGWYYNEQDDRWEWQRPRLFQMVEDVLPMSFTLPYLVPMLENAGAQVYLPRERDMQTHEAVVDNDSAASGYSETSGAWTAVPSGFGPGMQPYQIGVNPFALGTARACDAAERETATARWVPAIPEDGSYAVYISYASLPASTEKARYRVYHTGGVTEFLVNQQIGGGTWHYLGTFMFRKGSDPLRGAVVLGNACETPGRVVSADAVRFGGGMGVVARGGATSGRPKYVEGARYYLQYAGMPDTLVYSLNRNRSDYRDDYQCRAEYGNFLKGAPYGPNRGRAVKGLGIPIDLSLAFHTDAGITNGDTTVGTLSIYSLGDAFDNEKFPDSVSRMANRDLADLVQTQIVSDLRAKYDPVWNRRQLKNGDYSESVRPNMPSMLLELLSHQNFLDMSYVLDPRFRFDVARAIYKGMLRFLAAEYGRPAIVQPLPVTHMAAVLNGREAIVSWRPAEDPAEPTAHPVRYVVYTRTGDGGFDNGRVVTEPRATVPLEPGVIYGVKVTAANDGGESFPSEVLSICAMENDAKPVLIVNGFERICGPTPVKAQGMEGFLPMLDAGVPDRYEAGFTGAQHDFNRASAYRNNDAPGHGASSADYEGTVVAGNTFDFAAIHGRALRKAGRSFTTVSVRALCDTAFEYAAYPMIDLILGKQKETGWQKPFADSVNGRMYKAFPPALQRVLRTYVNGGGSLFVSGSYVGTELCARPKEDSVSLKFAREVLRINWDADHASRKGTVVSVSPRLIPKGAAFSFCVTPNSGIYAVEAPDALLPAGGSAMVLRYAENGFGAATAYKKQGGVVVFGFPYETILEQSAREALMSSILTFFGL